MNPDDDFCMQAEFFFQAKGKSGLLPLFWQADALLRALGPDVSALVQKSQIGYRNNAGFAQVWLPQPWVSKRPGLCLALSFGLGRQAEHPAVVQVAQPYPGRFTHHAIVQSGQELQPLLPLLQEAYAFSAQKRKRRL